MGWWVDGRMQAWLDGWMDGQTEVLSLSFSLYIRLLVYKHPWVIGKQKPLPGDRSQPWAHHSASEVHATLFRVSGSKA